MASITSNQYKILHKTIVILLQLLFPRYETCLHDTCFVGGLVRLLKIILKVSSCLARISDQSAKLKTEPFRRYLKKKSLPDRR